ncbi:MAG: zf-HC2 domain-containing protein [Bacteroidetes bacterium]|nr:zf-HC2 domain-containing protein [Bacteroidota bacterium]
MDCKTFYGKLPDYFRKEPDPEFKREMDKHMEGCVDCQRLAERIQSLETLIDREKEVKVNPFMTSRILNYLENRMAVPETPRIYFWKPALVTLGLLAAMAVGITLGSGGAKMTMTEEDSLDKIRSGLFVNDFMDENISINQNPEP